MMELLEELSFGGLVRHPVPFPEPRAGGFYALRARWVKSGRYPRPRESLPRLRFSQPP